MEGWKSALAAQLDQETEAVEKIFPELDETVKKRFDADKEEQYQRILDKAKQELI